EPGAVVAHLAEALDARGHVLHALALVLHGGLDGLDDATARALGAAEAAAQREGLPGDDAGRGAALDHAVRVVDPAHHLAGGVHVGRGDVALGAEDVDHLHRVAPRDALQLADAQPRGVDDDAALAAAVGEAGDGALPVHPRREGDDLVEGHVLVIADAALGGAQRVAVLAAVAREDLDLAVVHADGDAGDGGAHGVAEVLHDPRLEAHVVRRADVLLVRHLREGGGALPFGRGR